MDISSVNSSIPQTPIDTEKHLPPDIGEALFRSKQLQLEQESRRQQAQQALIETFMTLAKLNQENTKMQMQHDIASATLEEKQRSDSMREEISALRLGETQRHNLQTEIGKPTTVVRPETVKGQQTFGPEMGKVDVTPFTPTERRDRQREKLMDLEIAVEQIKNHFKRFRETAYGRTTGSYEIMRGLAGLNELYRPMENSKSMLSGNVIKVLGRDVGNIAIWERQVTLGVLGRFTDTPQEREDTEKVIDEFAKVARTAFMQDRDITPQEMSQVFESNRKQKILRNPENSDENPFRPPKAR